MQRAISDFFGILPIELKFHRYFLLRRSTAISPRYPQKCVPCSAQPAGYLDKTKAFQTASGALLRPLLVQKGRARRVGFRYQENYEPGSITPLAARLSPQPAGEEERGGERGKGAERPLACCRVTSHTAHQMHAMRLAASLPASPLSLADVLPAPPSVALDLA